MAAFKATGIHPFDPNVIKPAQMQPSQNTSTRASFPQPQTSPTRAVMVAFRDYSFTTQGTRPDSPPTAGPSSSLAASDPIPMATDTYPLPSTPSKRRDPASNPDLATPHKRMRLLGVGLANTSSGSFLVTKARVSHLEMKRVIHPPVLECVPGEIATPDWSLIDKHAPFSEFTRSALESQCGALEKCLLLAQQRLEAQEMIMEGQNAQLIIQNIGMERMNHSLHEKEKGKKSDRTVLFPGGKGRHLTDPELIKQKRELEDAKAHEEVEKVRKRVAKED